MRTGFDRTTNRAIAVTHDHAVLNVKAVEHGLTYNFSEWLHQSLDGTVGDLGGDVTGDPGDGVPLFGAEASIIFEREIDGFRCCCHVAVLWLVRGETVDGVVVMERRAPSL